MPLAITKFFIFSLVLFSSLHAQDAPQTARNFHQWGAITLFNGLPSDNVRAIAQTPDGVLWFGSDNGLARFDGRIVQTFALLNSGSNKVLALKVADDGTLWIGTQNGAIRYKDDKFQFIETTKNYTITAILFDENVLLATENGIILRLVERGESDFDIKKIPSETIYGSDEKPLKITSLVKIKNQIIAGTRSRSILVLENDETFETFSHPRPFFVNTIAKDERENVWLGADSSDESSGFYGVRDILNLQKTNEKTGDVLALAPDGDDGAWFGTRTRGLFHLIKNGQNIEQFTFENTSGGLRSNTIFAVFIDRENVVWLGTNRGVCRLDSSSPFNQTLSDNPNANFVRTLFRSNDGQIFAGTNRGMFLFDGESWLETGNFSSKSIYSIGEDSTKQLLISSSNGLYDYDGVEKLAGDVRSVASFRGRNYAAVFGRGIVQIENQTQVFANDSPTSLFADGDKKLWIGTVRDGVFTFDGKNVKSENALGILQGAPIRKITKGYENELWFAGERGLFRYKDNELQTIISNEDVRDVAIINGNIWATTLKSGLVHAKFDESFGWIISDLNVEQGLPSEQIFAILLLEKRLLIGTNRGIVNYVPSAISPQIVSTRVLSQRIYESEELKNVINLDFPQNSILVEVAGLSSRTFPEQFQYGFALEKGDGEIIEKKLSNDSQFAPVNLPSGDYQIKVRAYNKDLLPSKPLVIKFSVARAPFPFTATLLGVLLFAALMGLVWAGIERRRIFHKNRELATARFDLANEAERERKRIARDLHDQTLADLRKLMMMSDELPSKNSEFRAEIELVSTEIRRICEDLSPSVLENVGLNPALEFLLQHTIEHYTFSAVENLDERFDLKPNEQMQIYRIAQEVLNNIKRHSDAKFVEMKIDVSENSEFVLSIFDDGTPFNKVLHSSKGRGISNIESRANLIKAEIAWIQSQTGGNVFVLKR